MDFLRWIIGFIITIGICTFAVLNREQLDLYWNPLSHDVGVTVPVYIVALVSMAIGFMLGGIVVWLNAGKTRKEKRRQKKELKILEKEIGRLKEDKFKAEPPASEIFPALPVK